MKNIVVLGSDGQLGQCVKSLGHDFSYLTQDELDLRDPENVRLFFSDEKPQVILNLAAYTAVDRAEQEEDLAIAVNSESSEALAEVCENYIYVSTDYVFDGTNKEAYFEDDKTSPINAYGRSKLLGEQAAQRANKNSFIIRTSWLYSEFGNNFVKSMLKLAGEKKELSIVDDQVGSPTYARDLAEVIAQLALNIGKHKPGVYHYCNSGQCSWYEFAKEIFKIKNIDISLKPIPTSDYPTAAERPKRSVLNTLKIQSELGIQIPQWKESLKKCLTAL